MKTLLVIVIILIVLFVLACCLMEYINYMTFKHYEVGSSPFIAGYPYFKERYPREAFSFESRGNILHGYLYGAGGTKGLLVFCHGIWATAEDYLGLLVHFIDQGYQVFTYYNTGVATSQGRNLKGLPQSPIDLDSALTYIEGQERFQNLPVVVMGHSWGGFAAAAGLDFDHDVKASVSMSGFSDPTEVSLDTLVARFGKLGYVFRPVVALINYKNYGREARRNAVDAINKRQIPVLVTHGSGDDFIHYNFSAIMAHKDEITNPKAEFYTFSKPGRDGHNSFFNNDRNKEYNSKLQGDYEALRKQYKNQVPPEVTEDFRGKADWALATDGNEEIFNLVDDFYNRALSSL